MNDPTASSSVSTRETVDTNVLVYAHDQADAATHQIAKTLLRRLSDEGRLAYSVQVLNEFSSVMIRAKRVQPMTPEQVKEVVCGVEATGEVVPLTSSVTLRALGAMSKNSFPFWDALIWACAKENSLAVVYTEDFQHGHDVEGVRFVNPFAPAV